MEMLIDELSLDVTEPVIADWALSRLKSLRTMDKDRAKEMESRLFGEDVVADLLKGPENPFLQNRMFQILPPEKFRKAMPWLVKKWEKADFIVDEAAIGRIIAGNDPKQAADLFESFLKEDRDLAQNGKKWREMSSGLPHLEDDRQKSIAAVMIEKLEKAHVDPEAEWCMTLRLSIMRRYDFPGFEEAVKSYLRRMPAKESDDEYADILEPLVNILEFSDAVFFQIMDHLYKIPAPLFSEIPELYQSTAPLKEIDQMIQDVRKRSYVSVHAFLSSDEFRVMTPKSQILWDHLLADERFIDALHHKKQRPFFYGFLLIGVVSAMLAEKPRLEGLEMTRVCALLTLNGGTLTGIDDFIDYFRQADRGATVACLTAALDGIFSEGSSCEPGNLIRVVAGLDEEALLPPLSRLLWSRSISDIDFEQAFNICVGFGDRSIDYFSECFEKIDPREQKIALDIISEIGGESAARFLEKNFDALMALDRKDALDACERVGCVFCLDRIRSKLHKGQTDIDDAFGKLSLLAGRSTEEIRLLLKAYDERQRDAREITESLLEGDVFSSIKPYIDIEMRCRHCGDVNIYRARHVIVDNHEDHCVVGEFECINCGRLDELELTDDGKVRVSLEIMRLAMFQSKEEMADAMATGPIVMGRFSAFGKEMGIFQAIAAYEKKIQAHPKNAANYIGLGNIYNRMEKYSKAVKYFEQALDLDPEYSEVYHSLAMIAEEVHKDNDKALSWLKKGVPFLRRLKFNKYTILDKKEYLETYIEDHNRLVEACGGSKKDWITPIHASGDASSEFQGSGKRKIGRNDPCPCGSGKKYKKCCMNKP